MTGNKRAMYLYRVEIVLLILFFVISFFVVRDDAGTTSKRTDEIPLDTGWEVTAAGETVFYDKLPVSIKTSKDNTIWMSRTIDEVTAGSHAVGMFSFQKIVHAYIDDREVLSFENNSRASSKMPGNSWLFIDLAPEDAGKTLTLELHQCYGAGQVMVPVLYSGTVEGITNSYIKEKLPMLCLSVTGIAIGMLVIMFWVIAGKSLMLSEGLPWLGMFAVVRGIWSLLEANCYSFYMDNLLLLVWLSYVCLKTAVFPFAVFANITFHNGRSRLLKVITWGSLIDAFVTTLLQVFGIADYADTVLPTNLMVMVTGIYVFVTGVRNIYKSRVAKVRIYGDERKITYMAHTVSMLIMVVTSMIDVYRFYFTSTPDIGLYSRTGYLIYVAAVLLALLWDFARLANMGKEAEHIREEAAIDPMTKLYNRAAFEKGIDSYTGKQCRDKGIILFDLNNLKLYNDGLGHDMGDYYIKVSSELIRDLFGKYGNMYRIGGDEFCGIVENLTYEEFDRVRRELQEHISTLRVPGCEIEMGIAAGYCQYAAVKDSSLRDTMRRADEDMYQNKVLLKKGKEIR